MIRTDLDILLNHDPEYGPYKKRLSEFFAHRTKRQEQIRQDLNKEQDPQKFAKLELERLKREDPS